MKKIKEYRMSLMSKNFDEKSKIEGKSNYIIRCSAFLEVANYIKKQKFIEKEYDDFVLNSSKLLFEELLNHKRKTNINNVDSIGVWVSFEDGMEVDNSIDLSVLNDIKNYGSKDIEPIKEFFKMTLEI